MKQNNCNMNNIYRFEGTVPIGKAIPFGLPHFLPYKPEFHPGAIFAVCIIFLVSAAETIGDTSAMAAGGLMPPVGNFFASLPESVLGGCTIMMFGTIMTSGVEMIAKCGFTQRNITIVALSLAIGIGFTAASEEGLWNIFPNMVQDVFASNVVAVVFVVAVVLNLVLPANMDIHHENKK